MQRNGVATRFGAVLTAVLIATVAVPVRAGAAEPTDVTAPTITDVGVPDGARINNVLTLHPVVSDDVAVTRVELLVDGRVKAGAMSAPWTLVWNSRAIAEDDVELEVAVFDAAGNRSAVSVTVHVDNVAPIVNFASGWRSVNGVVPFEFVDWQNEGDLASIELLVGGKVVGVSTAAPWTISWDTTGYRGRTIVTARSTDTLGNARTLPIEVMVDYTGPDLTVAFPLADGYISARGHVFTSMQDDAGVARVELLVNGNLVSSVANGDNASSLRWDPRSVNGTATMTVRAYDRLGNVTELTRKVVVDNDAPTAVTVAPAQHAKVRGVFTATVTGVRDTSGVAQVDVRFNDETSVDVHAPFTTKVDSRGVSDGPHPLVWNVFDKAGNLTRVSRTVIVDTRAPSVTITKAPKNKARVKGTVKITAKASDRNGVNRVELLVNGKVVGTDRHPAYAFKVNTKRYGKKITVQVRAHDHAGNVTYTTKRTWRR